MSRVLCELYVERWGQLSVLQNGLEAQLGNESLRGYKWMSCGGESMRRTRILREYARLIRLLRMRSVVQGMQRKRPRQMHRRLRRRLPKRQQTTQWWNALCGRERMRRNAQHLWRKTQMSQQNRRLRMHK